MPTFADRLRAVIGEEVALHGWALQHGLPPPKVWDWLKHNRTPRRPQIAELAKATGISLEWWLDGDLPPPTVNQAPRAEVPQVVPTTAYGHEGVPEHLKVEEHPALPPIEVRRMQGKINVDALTAIIEGALKTAPNAAPRALAEHCAKIYAQAIEAGLITPDGLGPGRTDKAA